MMAAAAPLARAQFLQTAGGTYDYNTPGNWVDGNINGVWGSDLTLGGSQTITFDTATTLSGGLKFDYSGTANMTFRGTVDTTLTLGGDIAFNPTGAFNTDRSITFGSNTTGQNLNIDLGGATRATTTVGNVNFVNVISNGGLTINKGGTTTFSSANTYSGATTVIGNTVFSGNSGSAVNSDVTIKTTGASTTTLTLASGANGSGITRAKSVTLDGSSSQSANTAILRVDGNSTTNTVETITGALKAANGFGIVQISPDASRNTRLTADSFTRENGGVALFRGTNLGVNTVASQTAGSSNITFTNAPTLTGGGGAAGTSTVSILKGAYGDTSASGSGAGLVTYDSTNGVRLLNTATEYTSTITDGQTQLDNVRIVGDNSVGGVSVTITGNTTVNSLSLIQAATNTNKAGVLVQSTGTGTTLNVASGAIFAIVNSTNSTDEVQINTAKLGFNNQEAVIIAAGSSGSGASNLSISSEITNASALTKSGNGVLKITGTTDNTYTGDTIMAGGTLELNKTAGKNAIGGNLVVNAGSVSLTAANQIGDTKDITVNGGIMNFAATGVNSRDETFRNLTMTGGVVNSGTTSGGTTTTNTVSLTNATLTGGVLNVIRKSVVQASGGVSISGDAQVIVDRYTTTNTTLKTALSVGTGGLAITQAASGASTPITLTGGNAAGIKGGELILNGDVTFTGNGSNTNTTTIGTIAATSGGGEGLILLNGTRTFNIGNGSAANDLTINAALTDGTSTGGLTKSGTGTLLLNADNTYSGDTTVTGGTLALGAGNRLANTSRLVMSGGTFATGGFSETLGTLQLTANSVIDLGNNGAGSALAFAASNSETWTPSVSLSIINFTDGVDSVFFGVGGLTGAQLAQIRINGTNLATLDGSGFLAVGAAIPEPSTYASLAGLGCFLLAATRRRRAA
jgi:autotransporter-associated beta strand protein